MKRPPNPPMEPTGAASGGQDQCDRDTRPRPRLTASR